MTNPEQARLDKWLWAARFYKTRSLAATAITAGKVEVGGERPKRAKAIKVGDVVRVRKGPLHYEVTVRAIAERRGPPASAQALYEETPESVAERERITAELRLEREMAPTPIFQKGRPTKRDRRELVRFKLRSDSGD